MPYEPSWRDDAGRITRCSIKEQARTAAPQKCGPSFNAQREHDRKGLVSRQKEMVSYGAGGLWPSVESLRTSAHQDLPRNRAA